MKQTWLRMIVAIAGVQGLFALWLLVLFFYRAGAYFLDAGFYVYAIASDEAPTTPTLVRDAWGDNVFLTHTTMSPMAISALLRPLVGVPFNFIGYLTIQHSLLAVAGASILSLIALIQGSSKRHVLLLGAVGAIGLPLSNVGLGSLAYPHVEILGSSSIALAVCLLTAQWKLQAPRWLTPLAIMLLVTGFLVREDMGGHLAIAATTAILCANPKKIHRRRLIQVGSVGAFGAISTILLLLFQRVVMGSDGSFDISYAGNPPYEHITSIWYLIERFSFFIGSRLDLVVGLSAFVLFGLLLRQRALFAYPLACLPWIFLNVTSVDPNKHGMGIYGMFPIVIYLTAPLLVLVLRPDMSEAQSQQEQNRSVSTEMSYLIAVLGLFLGGIAGPPNGGGYVFHTLLRYPIIGPGEISLVHTLIKDFPKGNDTAAVDDAVMSLEPVVLADTPLISRVQEPSAYDRILFFPNFGLGRPQVRDFLDKWITEGKSIKISCLPGGMARADKLDTPPTKELTARGQLNRASRCHKVPSL